MPHDLGDDIFLLHLPYDLPPYEDEALPPSSCHPDIGLSRLPRAVHDAPHDRYRQRRRYPGEAPLHFRCNPRYVDRDPPARRAGEKFRAPLPYSESFEDLPPDAHFLLGRSGDGYPQGVPDPFREEDPKPDGRSDRVV